MRDTQHSLDIVICWMKQHCIKLFTLSFRLKLKLLITYNMLSYGNTDYT